MLKEILYWIVYRLADIHNWILQINNGFEYNLSDKMLHFLVIGAVGMVLFWIVHPVIHFLARRGLQVIISWFYALTLVLVITFGIEIGQKITGTGHMEFADIVFGVGGYLAFFAAYMLLCLIILGIRKLIRRWKMKKKKLSSVHHIAIIVSDYAAAKEFYVKKLGLTVVSEVYRPERRDWKLDLQLNETTQLEIFAEENPPSRVTHPEAAGLRHLAFHVSDVEATAKELNGLGIPTEPIRTDAGGKHFTFFSDPDGLPLELHE